MVVFDGAWAGKVLTWAIHEIVFWNIDVVAEAPVDVEAEVVFAAVAVGHMEHFESVGGAAAGDAASPVLEAAVPGFGCTAAAGSFAPEAEEGQSFGQNPDGHENENYRQSFS